MGCCVRVDDAADEAAVVACWANVNCRNGPMVGDSAAGMAAKAGRAVLLEHANLPSALSRASACRVTTPSTGGPQWNCGQPTRGARLSQIGSTRHCWPPATLLPLLPRRGSVRITTDPGSCLRPTYPHWGEHKSVSRGGHFCTTPEAADLGFPEAQYVP